MGFFLCHILSFPSLVPGISFLLGSGITKILFAGKTHIEFPVVMLFVFQQTDNFMSIRIFNFKKGKSLHQVNTPYAYFFTRSIEIDHINDLTGIDTVHLSDIYEHL